MLLEVPECDPRYQFCHLSLMGRPKSFVGNVLKVLVKANEKIGPQGPKSESYPPRIRDLCFIAQDVDLFDLQAGLLIKEQGEAGDQKIPSLRDKAATNIIGRH